MARISELQPIVGNQTKTNDLFVTVNLESGDLGTKNITRRELVAAIQQENFNFISITGGSITNTQLNNTNINNSSLSNSQINNSSIIGGSSLNLQLNNPTITGGSITNTKLNNIDIDDSFFTDPEITNPSIIGGTIVDAELSQVIIENSEINQTDIFGGTITESEIIDPNFDITETYTPNLNEDDYFIIKDVLSNNTVKITFQDLQDEIAKSLEKSTKIYVDSSVIVSGNGSYYKPYKTLEEAFEVIQTLNQNPDRLLSPVSISVMPGDHYTNGELPLPDNCSVVSTNGQYATNIIMNTGFESKNVFLVGSGCYVQGFTFRNQRIDNLDNPTGGFALAFRPGATIIRSPYMRDCGQVSNYTGETIAAPINPRNSQGTLADLGGNDFPNPLVGRGGGVILVDRAVLNQNSLFPYILAFGATPRSPNGIGYCAKNGAGINGIGSITIFQRCAFYALNGGQITLNNSGTQFGDISMRSNGSTGVVDPYTVEETVPIVGNEELSEYIFERSEQIANQTWDYLTVTEGFESYNSAKCKRDLGLILDGISKDIALSTNYWAVLNGLSYLRQSAAVVIQDQLTETVGAINYLKESVAALIGSHAPSVTASNAAFDEIISIIEGNQSSTLVFADTGTADKDNARKQLRANRQLIITRLITWISQNFPTLNYDQAKCERDTGYIIDALSHDINYTSNLATIANAEAYFLETVSKLPDQAQKDATAAAINELGLLCSDVIQGTLSGQNLSNPVSSLQEATRAILLTDIISNVITADSLSGLPRRKTPDKSWITDLGLIDSKSKIETNRYKLQSETIRWIGAEFSFLDEALTKRDTGFLIRSITYDLLQENQTATRNFVAGFFDYKADRVFIPTNEYDYEKCYRDTKLITDAISYDMLFGSNFRTIKAGAAYYRANADKVINEQLSITLNAINKQRQEILDLVAGDVASETRVIDRFELLLDIIQNGETAIPAFNLPDPANYDTGFFNARRLIINNTDYIKAEIEAWIANNFPDLVYDVEKCMRDVELILEAVRYDITYGGNLETLVAGLSYFVGAMPQYGEGERQATIGAYQRLRDIIGLIARGVAVQSTTGNTETQTLTPPVGSVVAANFAQSRIEDIIQIIETNASRIPTRILPNATWPAQNFIDSFDLIVANSTLISNNVLEDINIENKTLLGAFILSYDFIKDLMITLTSEFETIEQVVLDDEKEMITGLFDDIIKRTILGPNRLRFGSLIESIGHQFNLAGAGVNKNALPLNFRRVGRPLPASGSVLQENGGRVRWSGADELNNQYFARGLKINGRTGRLEGRPFTSSVRRLARRAANSRTFT